MSESHVIGLDKRLHGQLPVAGHDFCDVSSLVTILKIKGGKVLGQVLEIRGQGLTFRVKVHKNKPTPGADLCLWQRHFPLVDMGKIPLLGDVDELSF